MYVCVNIPNLTGQIWAIYRNMWATSRKMCFMCQIMSNILTHMPVVTRSKKS